MNNSHSALRLSSRSASIKLSIRILLTATVLIALIIAAPRFFTLLNATNILLQSSITAIVALGLALPILTGGIDLSVGSTAALAGAISAGFTVRFGWTSAAAILLALLLGAALGLIIGLLIVRGKLPPFVASLSMMSVGRGLTLVYTEGRPISGLPEDYLFLSSELGPIPVSVIFLLLIVLSIYFLLTRTKFGHSIYAVGGNMEAARLAGIPTGKIVVVAYVISGVTAAFAGVLLTARLWSAQPTAAVGMELDAIAAVVLGGVSLMGGSGHAGGPLLGALIVGVIGNVLNHLKIQSYIQQIIKGLILIAAVLIDIRSRQSKSAHESQIIAKEQASASNSNHT